MSDAPPERPDLHAIFGLEEQGVSTVRAISLSGHEDSEHSLPGDQIEGGELSPLEPEVALEHVERIPEETAEPPRQAVKMGVTPPTRRGSSSRFITDVIIEMGLVPRHIVDEAVETARNSGARPERVLLESRALTSDGLARALAERYGLDHLDLSVFATDMGAANLVTTTAAKRYQAVPVSFVDKRTLLVAMADPSNVLAVDDIAIMTGYDVRVAVAAAEDIASLILRLDRLEDVVTGSDGGIAEDLEDDRAEVVDLHESADDAPVIKLVNQVVAQAVEQHASDVHLAPDGRELRVRFRVDGVLQDVTTVTRRLASGVISRVKIMADLDIAEKRLPQDGRVGLTVDGRHVDLRVVTLPSVHGETVVMRILDKDSVVMKLERLGMGEEERSASSGPSARLMARCSRLGRPARASRRPSMPRCRR